MYPNQRIADRFRGYLPVVIDVETGGFDPKRDALLEIAAVVISMDDSGRVYPDVSTCCQVAPFEGSNIEQKSLEITGIDPHHPFRMAVEEEKALQTIFEPVRMAMRDAGCKRSVLVGHNAAFDLAFLNAAVKRSRIKRNPFHPFTNFDTATLGAIAYGHTVLATIIDRAEIEWDQSKAHSALYDAEKTAELFCRIINKWDDKIGVPGLTEY
ncbi:MAG: ribonuclease T [bacterium]